MPNETFQDKIQNQRQFFKDMMMFYDQTTDIDANEATKISSWLQQLITALDTSNPSDFDCIDHELSQQTLDAHNGLKKYVNDALKKGKTYHTKDLKKLANILDSKPYIQVLDACQTRIDFDNKCVGDEKPINKEITDYINNFGLYGTKPTISECLDMDITKDDPEKVLGHFIWLSKNEYMSNRLYKNNYGGIYKETIDKLLDQLDNADPDVAMKYALKIFSLETSVKDLCLKKYNEYKAEAPQNTDPELYAHVKLNESNEYHTLESINGVKNTIATCRVAKAMTGLKSDPFIKANNDFDKRDSSFIGDLIAGEMTHFLTKNKIVDNVKKVTAAEFDQNTEELKKSGYLSKPELQTLIDDFKLMLNDKEKKSTTFMAMQNGLKAFLDQDHATITDKAAYEKKLDDAIKFTQAYYKKNSGYKFTKNGAKRRDYSNALLSHLNSYKLSLVPKELDQSGFYEEGHGDMVIATTAVNEAYAKGISKEKYLEVMLAKDKPAGDDLSDLYKEAQKNNPDLPDLDLTLTENEIQERKAIQDIARKNFYSSTYDMLSLDEQVLLGAKMGEYREKEAQMILDNRDIPKFFLKYNNDTQTKLDNIAIITKLQIDDHDKRLPSRVEEYNQNVYDLLSKRISELEQIDYNKYFGMNDKELAENYPKFQQDCVPCSIINRVMSAFKDNPLITQELKDRAKALENKYSNIVTSTNERIQILTNPYYTKSKNPCLELSGDQSNTLMAEFSLNVGRDLSAYITKGNGANLYGNEAFVDQIKTQVCTNASDINSFNNVNFYDLKSKQINANNLLFIAKKEPIIAINNDNPKKFAFFTANKENTLAKQVDLKDKLLSEYHANKQKNIVDKPIEKQHEEVQKGNVLNM